MDIRFWYPMTGVLSAPFFRIERLVEWIWPVVPDGVLSRSPDAAPLTRSA